MSDRPNSLRDLATSDVFTVREIIREVLRLTRNGQGPSLQNLRLNFVAATSDGRDVPLIRGGESVYVNLDNAHEFVRRLHVFVLIPRVVLNVWRYAKVYLRLCLFLC